MNCLSLEACHILIYIRPFVRRLTTVIVASILGVDLLEVRLFRCLLLVREVVRLQRYAVDCPS